MSALNSYLSNNNIKLTSENYNEVDAMVMSELIYFKAENLPEGMIDWNQGISVQEYARILKDNFGDCMSENQYTFIENLCNNERYSDCIINNFQAENQESQWAAFTVDINGNRDSSIVAFRGTDSTALGWTEDLLLGYDTDGTEAQRKSAEYLKEVDSSNIYLSGHSKGGNDAISAYIMSDGEIRDRVTRIDNFDGPGVNKEIKDTYINGYKELEDKLHSFFPKDSIVGQFLSDVPGERKYVNSVIQDDYKDMGMVGEHDPFSFVISKDGDGFEYTSQSFISKVFDGTIDNTLASLTNEQRQLLIDILIKLKIPNIIANDGSVTFENGEGEIDVIAKEWNNLSDEEKRMVASGIALLISYGIINWVSVANMGINIDFMISTYVDLYNELIVDNLQHLEELYLNIDLFVSRFIKSFKDNLVIQFDNIVDKIIEGYERLEEFINNIKPSKNSGAGDNFDMQINMDNILAEGDSLYQVSRELDRLTDEIFAIRFQMNSGIWLKTYPSFSKVISQIEKSGNTLKIMDNKLEKVCNAYRKNEQNLIRNL